MWMIYDENDDNAGGGDEGVGVDENGQKKNESQLWSTLCPLQQSIGGPSAEYQRRGCSKLEVVRNSLVLLPFLFSAFRPRKWASNVNFQWVVSSVIPTTATRNERG